jgi:hypothetical protein
MGFPISITFRGTRPSKALCDTLESQAALLERTFVDIIRCAITVEEGTADAGVVDLHLRISIALPKDAILVSWSTPVDVAAKDVPDVRAAFAEARRRLVSYASRDYHSLQLKSA